MHSGAYDRLADRIDDSANKATRLAVVQAENQALGVGSQQLAFRTEYETLVDFGRHVRVAGGFGFVHENGVFGIRVGVEEIGRRRAMELILAAQDRTVDRGVSSDPNFVVSGLTT